MGEVRVMTADEERDYLAELLDDSLCREKALEERALRAEQRVRDLEEAQGELLEALDALVTQMMRQWVELTYERDRALAARDHLREAVERALERIARGDFADRGAP